MGSASDRGISAGTRGLKWADLGIPAARADTSGASLTLDTRLEYWRTNLENMGVADRTWQDSGWSAVMWRDSGWSAVTWSGSGWSAETWSGSGWSAETWSGSGWSAETWSDSGRSVEKWGDSGRSAETWRDSGGSAEMWLGSWRLTEKWWCVVASAILWVHLVRPPSQSQTRCRVPQ